VKKKKNQHKFAANSMPRKRKSNNRSRGRRFVAFNPALIKSSDEILHGYKLSLCRRFRAQESARNSGASSPSSSNEKECRSSKCFYAHGQQDLRCDPFAQPSNDPFSYDHDDDDEEQDNGLNDPIASSSSSSSFSLSLTQSARRVTKYFAYSYLPVACGCSEDDCNLCHSWIDYAFHPLVFRTEMCRTPHRDFTLESCCPFAHNKSQLRTLTAWALLGDLEPAPQPFPYGAPRVCQSDGRQAHVQALVKTLRENVEEIPRSLLSAGGLNRINRHLDVLPVELWLSVFGNLDRLSDSRAAALVCRRWRQILRHRSLWKHVDVRGDALQRIVDELDGQHQEAPVAGIKPVFDKLIGEEARETCRSLNIDGSVGDVFDSDADLDRFVLRCVGHFPGLRSLDISSLFGIGAAGLTSIVEGTVDLTFDVNPCARRSNPLRGSTPRNVDTLRAFLRRLLARNLTMARIEALLARIVRASREVVHFADVKLLVDVSSVFSLQSGVAQAAILESVRVAVQRANACDNVRVLDFSQLLRWAPSNVPAADAPPAPEAEPLAPLAQLEADIAELRYGDHPQLFQQQQEHQDGETIASSSSSATADGRVHPRISAENVRIYAELLGELRDALACGDTDANFYWRRERYVGDWSGQARRCATWSYLHSAVMLDDMPTALALLHNGVTVSGGARFDWLLNDAAGDKSYVHGCGSLCPIDDAACPSCGNVNRFCVPANAVSMLNARGALWQPLVHVAIDNVHSDRLCEWMELLARFGAPIVGVRCDATSGTEQSIIERLLATAHHRDSLGTLLPLFMRIVMSLPRDRVRLLDVSVLVSAIVAALGKGADALQLTYRVLVELKRLEVQFSASVPTGDDESLQNVIASIALCEAAMGCHEADDDATAMASSSTAASRAKLQRKCCLHARCLELIEERCPRAIGAGSSAEHTALHYAASAPVPCGSLLRCLVDRATKKQLESTTSAGNPFTLLCQTTVEPHQVVPRAKVVLPIVAYMLNYCAVDWDELNAAANIRALMGALKTLEPQLFRQFQFLFQATTPAAIKRRHRQR
jgi:F-box-like